MLINFTIKNVKSFKDVSSFSLISKNKIRKNSFHEVEVLPRLCVLKNAGLYGSNASGKTNFVKALSFAKEFITTGNVSDIKFGFMDNQNEDSVFSFLIELSGILFHYELHLRRISGFFLSIQDEYLAQLNNDGSTNKIIYLKSKNIFDDENNKKLKIFSAAFKNLSSVAFLTYMAAPERYVENSKVSEIFKKLFLFFLNKLVVVDSFTNVYSIINDTNIDSIICKLRDYDTGIKSAKFVKVENDSIYRYLPAPLAKDLISQLIKSPQNAISIGHENELLLLKKTENNSISLYRLLVKHYNISNDFSFADESNGTKRLSYLIGILLSKSSNDRVYVIDEIEKGSHPNLIRKLIQDFQALNKETNAQLIFTSHLPSLMDNVLRRDEIFFIEKNNKGCSNIYSLYDFKDRSTTTIAKKYLDGRFGATPDLEVSFNASD